MIGSNTDEAEWAAQDAQVYRLAMSLLKDQDQAQDVVQEAWLGALTKNLARGGKQLASYLKVSVRNGVFQAWRDGTNRRHKERAGARSEATSSNLDHLAQGECGDLLREAVGKLREPYRSAIRMHFFGAQTSAQIATQLGSKDVTVRSQIKRGLEQLRKDLDAGYGRGQWTAGLLLLLERKAGWVPGPSDTLIATRAAATGFSSAALVSTLGALLFLVLGPLLFSRWYGTPSETSDLGRVALPFGPGVASMPLPTNQVRRARFDAPGFQSQSSAQDPSAAGLQLTVLDLETGEPLHGIQLMESERGLSPYLDGAASPVWLAQDATSPVRIERSQGPVLRRLWVRAEGYSWQALRIKNPGQGERSQQAVALAPGASLLLDYHGEAKFGDVKLRIREPNARDFLTLLPLDSFPIALSGLPAGELLFELSSGKQRRLVNHGADFFTINPKSLASVHQRVNLLAGHLNQVQLIGPGLSPDVIRNDFNLILRIHQQLDLASVLMKVVPAAIEGYELEPYAIERTLSVDATASQMELSVALSLAPGSYKLSLNPLCYFQEFEVQAWGDVVLDVAPSERVTLELGTSFWGSDKRPQSLFFERQLDTDHAALATLRPIDWDLHTCSALLSPGHYRVVPILDGALHADLRAMEFELRPGAPLTLPMTWEGDGLARRPIGMRLELRQGASIVAFNCPAISLTPIGHGGAQVPFQASWHPDLLGPGRFLQFPNHGPRPEQAATPWALELRVTQPGDYLLESISLPPYRPTKPQVVRIAPGRFSLVSLELSLP